MFLNKQKKFRKGRLCGISESIRAPQQSFNYGIRVKETGYITASQLEAARKVIQKIVKRQKRFKSVHLRVNTSISRSRKKKGIRMGGSKGGFYEYVYRARPGMLLFEVKNVTSLSIRYFFRYLISKLPIQADIIVLRNSYKWNF